MDYLIGENNDKWLEDLNKTVDRIESVALSVEVIGRDVRVLDKKIVNKFPYL